MADDGPKKRRIRFDNAASKGAGVKPKQDVNTNAARNKQSRPLESKRNSPGSRKLPTVAKGNRSNNNYSPSHLQPTAPAGVNKRTPLESQLQALHDDVLKAVEYRESLIAQLQSLVRTWPSKRVDKALQVMHTPYPEAVRVLRNLSGALREAGLRCVEKIVAWVLFYAPEAQEPTAFLYKEEDYLLKMYRDLDFVSDALGGEATHLASFCRGNPLLLTEEEIQGRGIRALLGRVHAAGVVILDVVRRHRKRQRVTSAMAAATPGTAAAAAAAKAGTGLHDPLMESADELVTRASVSPSAEAGAQSPARRAKTPPKTPPSAAHPASPASPKSPSRASATGKGLTATGRPKSPGSHSVPPLPNAEVLARPATVSAEAQRLFPKGSKIGKVYEIEAVLGEGAYGWVIHARSLRSGQHVAIKKFKEDEEEDEETAEYVMKTQVREIKFLRKLRHPNIVHLLEDFEEEETGAVFLVFELVMENCLQAMERLAPSGGLKGDTVRSLSQQLIDAITHCHKHHVVHRDVKPENLLLTGLDTKHPVLNLCDFGTAREEAGSADSKGGLTHYVGSRWYRAPELLGSSTSYTKAIDMWSCGCIIAEMLSGHALFQGDKEVDVLVSMMTLLGTLPGPLASYLVSLGLDKDKVTSRKAATRSLSSIVNTKGGPDAADFVGRMLLYDATARMQAWASLPQHAYLHASEREDTKMHKTRALERAMREEHEGKLSEVLKVLTGRNQKVTEQMLGILTGARKPKDVDSDVARALADMTVAVQEQFCDRFSMVADPAEKVRMVQMLHAVVADTAASRVSAVRAWLGSKGALNGLNMGNLIDSLDAEHSAAGKPEKRLCAACLMLAARVHAHLTTCGVDDVLAMASSPVNVVISCVSRYLLSTDIIYAVKKGHLERLMGLLGFPSPTENPGMLSPTSKAILLHMRQLDDAIVRTQLVLSRDTAKREVFETMKQSGTAKLRRGRMTGGVAHVFLPYFRSEYGRKVINGVNVEEGEGLGPRKELFSLISAQLQQVWTPVKLSEPLLASAQAGTSWLQSAKAGGFGEGVVAPGHQVVVHVQPGPTPETSVVEKRIITRMQGTERISVEKPWSLAFTNRLVDVLTPASPILVYHQARECLWLNTKLPRNDENTQRLRLFGSLLALTLVNQVTLDLNLPPLFFKITLAGSRYEPCMADLVEYDPAIAQTLEAIRAMPMEKFKEVMAAEGHASGPISKEIYIRQSMADVLQGDAVAWMYDAIRLGITQVLPIDDLDSLAVSDRDLRVMTCGANEAPEEDFDFQHVFQVVHDQDISPMVALLWQTVATYDAKRKRALLKFITGVSKLPTAGTELLKIESPFVAFDFDDHRKILQTLPQSHTCDNILELPNYFDSLCRLWVAEHLVGASRRVPSDVSDRLKAQAARILEIKLTLAIENSHGYGLDDLGAADRSSAATSTAGGGGSSMTSQATASGETSAHRDNVGGDGSKSARAATPGSARSDDIPVIGDEHGAAAPPQQDKPLTGRVNVQRAQSTDSVVGKQQPSTSGHSRNPSRGEEDYDEQFEDDFE